MTEIVSKAGLAKKSPHWEFSEGVDLREHIQTSRTQNGVVAEFIGTGDFGRDFIRRQEFEVDAGRDAEPILYETIYNPVVDANLTKHIDIDKMGPGAFVFEEIQEGGEVKFGRVGSSEETVSMRHFGVGAEYDEDLFMYNQTWRLAPIERQVGVAYNALLNHLHLGPILNYGYAAANQTLAVVGATLYEGYQLTLQAAVTAAKTDTSNPRRGPYDLIISSANMFTMEIALFMVPQQGFTKQAPTLNQMIRNVIIYDGWSGVRGKKSVQYAGVAANKAYLVNVDPAYVDMDFKSYFKHQMRRTKGDSDMSRFILEQDIWDTRLAVYTNPLRAVEEVTLPTTTS